MKILSAIFIFTLVALSVRADDKRASTVHKNDGHRYTRYRLTESDAKQVFEAMGSASTVVQSATAETRVVEQLSCDGWGSDVERVCRGYFGLSNKESSSKELQNLADVWGGSDSDYIQCGMENCSATYTVDIHCVRSGKHFSCYGDDLTHIDP